MILKMNVVIKINKSDASSIFALCDCITKPSSQNDIGHSSKTRYGGYCEGPFKIYIPIFPSIEESKLPIQKIQSYISGDFLASSISNSAGCNTLNKLLTTVNALNKAILLLGPYLASSQALKDNTLIFTSHGKSQLRYMLFNQDIKEPLGRYS